MKIPPHNIESEQAVIGSILLEPESAYEKAVTCGVKSETFYDHANRMIFEAISDMMSKDSCIDAISLSGKLSKAGNLERIGGIEYLERIMDVACVPAHVTQYSKEIVDCRLRRSIIESSAKVIESAYNQSEEIDGCLAELQSIGIDKSEERRKPQIIFDAKDYSFRVSAGQQMGIPTPFIGFNRSTYGIPRGIVCPLAGRGGKGKSMIKTAMTAHLIMQGIPVLDFCLEDGDIRSANRLAASIGEYDLFRLIRANVSSEYMDFHYRCLDKLENLPYFPDQSAGTVEDLVVRIGRFVRENNAEIRSSGGVVFIDGIKDVIPTKGENKTAQEEHISQSLSRCAVKHNDITIIPITHLTKLDTDTWITLNNIRGSALQVANARAAMILQDAGFDHDTKQAADFSDDIVVLEMAKTNYGQAGRTILKKEFEKGRFVEVESK